MQKRLKLLILLLLTLQLLKLLILLLKIQLLLILLLLLLLKLSNLSTTVNKEFGAVFLGEESSFLCVYMSVKSASVLKKCVNRQVFMMNN